MSDIRNAISLTDSRRRMNSPYFTEFTIQKAIFYAVATFYVVVSSTIVFIEPFLTLTCIDDSSTTGEIIEGNPEYIYDPCKRTRFLILAGRTAEECSFGRRLVISAILGGLIGWERKMADRPAGIRTISLVSLGSCLFTINSAWAFIGGPMSWDAARISAAIPSGVGFLGAGIIFKENTKDNATGENSHVVHGLTTAASLWLSSAVGIACGGELYYPATFSVAVVLVLLRFGPRHITDSEEEESKVGTDYLSIARETQNDTELQQILTSRAGSSISRRSPKSRASLASIVR